MRILSAQHNAHISSQIHWSWVLALQSVSFATVVISLLVSDPRAVVCLAALGLTSLVGAFVLRQVAGGYDARANALRSAALLEDGLGYRGQKLEKSLAAIVPEHKKAPAPDEDGSYYASALPRGWHRLAEDLAESAYFTGYQSQRLANLYGLLAGGGAVVTVIGFVVYSQFGTTPSCVNTSARLTIALLSTFGTGDLTSLALGYLRQANVSGDVCESAYALSRKEDADPADVVIEFSRYTGTLGRVPPFPNWLWRQCKDMLNERWRGERSP